MTDGPAPRNLPALPLQVADGRLLVAGPFTARPGFEQGMYESEGGPMMAKRIVLAAVAGVALIVVALDAQRPLPPPPGPPPPPLPMPAILKAYPPVTAERLLKPADGEWLMIRRTYDGWGYSPLDQITPANVRAAAAGVDLLDRRRQRTRSAADRERRRAVRVDAGQPGHCRRGQDRTVPLALSPARFPKTPW